MTSNADPIPLLKVRGPGDLAQAVPYLLGFHPSRSLVLVGLRAKRVVVTARIDLDDLAEASLLPHTVAAMARGRAEAFVALVYDDELRVEPGSSPRGADGRLAWAALADRVHDVAAAHGEVDEVALVCRRRMWSFDCSNPRCCPPEGRELDGASMIAAEAAFAGLVALPDRASLVGLFDPVPERDSPVMRAAVSDAEKSVPSGGDELRRRNRADVRALFAAARRADEPGAPPELDFARVGRFAVALRRTAVRDPVWFGVDAERIDGRPFWRRLATSVPAPFDAVPLLLFGWASYRAGNGALANIAAERAQRSDPDDAAADFLLAAVGHGVDPRQLPRLSRADREVKLAVGRRVRATRRAAPPAAAGRRPR